MNKIEQINLIPLEDILQILGVKYKKHGKVGFLYHKGKLTNGWRADFNRGIVSDFSNGGRASGDRIKFVEQYLGISFEKALQFFGDRFNIKKNKMEEKRENNLIKEKWDNLDSLSEEQIQYLANRRINNTVARNYNGNICLPIRTGAGHIISLQSRSITDTGSRYYVEAKTESDGIFAEGLNPEIEELFVVEGFTDFLSLRQFTTNVVGLINAKNDGQLRIIKELSTKYQIYFIPDNDEAGQVSLEKLKALGVKFNLFKLSDYGVKDINELLVNFGIGEEILEQIRLESEKPISNIRLALEKAKVYQKLRDENGGRLGYSTGYPLIDDVTGGFIKGKTYLIMAFSNVGKTRFAYSFCRSLIRDKKKIHFYSLEVDTGMLIIELLSAVYQMDRDEVINKIDKFPISEIEKYVEIYDDIRKLEDIENNIRELKPDIAFIDFVQNIEQAGDEYQKTTEIALRLQKLGILTGTTLVNLSQVNNESRFSNGEGIMPKGSGALFASSDVILSLRTKDNDKYLTVSKNKFGRARDTFLVNVDFNKSIFNLAKELEEEKRMYSSVIKKL